MQAHEQAADILLRVLEALARQNRKTLSAATRADVERACELLSKGDDYDSLLEDLLTVPPIDRHKTVSFDRKDYYGATDDPEFVAAIGQRRGAPRP